MKNRFTNLASGFKYFAQILFYIISFISPTVLFAQNPLAAANGFNVMTSGNLTINAGDIEGAIGVGGNFTVTGSSQIPNSNTGAGVPYVTIGGIKYSLVVNGNLVGTTGGNSFKINGKTAALDDHFIKIGGFSPATSTIINSGSNLLIGNPPTDASNQFIISNNTNQAKTTVQGSGIFDFASAITTLKDQSVSKATGCTTNVTVTANTGQTTTSDPRINLSATGTNVWNITGAQLNAFNTLTFITNLPSSTKSLIINVNASGAFTWNNKNLAGLTGANAPYIIWNFYNATAVTVQNAAVIEGSILAPLATVTHGNGNIEGQIIAASYIRPSGSGELHSSLFLGSITCGTATVDCSCVTSPNNLLVNPSFESGTTGWAATGTTSIGNDANYTMCGASAGIMYRSTTTAGISTMYQDVNVAAGSIVSFSGYAGIHAAGNTTTCDPKLSLVFYNSAGTIISTISTARITWIVENNANRLTQYSLSGTAPAGTVKVRVQASIACNEYVKLDAMCLTATCSAANAGPDLTNCNNWGFNMGATAAGSGETGTWTVVSGSASITSANSPTSTVTINTSPTVLRWTITRTGCSNSDDVILINKVIAINESQTNVLCNGASTGAINLTIAGGVTPYTFNWGAGAPTTEDRTGLAAGTYTVTVTDAALCTSSATFIITQPSAIVPTLTSTNPTCFGAATGTINASATGGTNLTGASYELWYNISGSSVSSLTSNASYPGSPSVSTIINSAVGYTNFAENFGGRISGYIIPPTTGSYVFWISSDDDSQLFLSTTNSSSNKVQIASVSGFTNPLEWTKFTSQKSVAITLTAGQLYYFEALYKEGGGGDNIAIGWSKPGQVTTAPSEVIPGQNMRPNLASSLTNPTFQYKLDGGVLQSSGAFTGVSAGPHTITFQDANGCTTTANVTLTQPTDISVTNSITNVKCNSGSTGAIDITVSGGTGSYTYLWSKSGSTFSATSEDITGLTIGTYSVVIKDANNCSKTLNFLVTEPTSLSISLSPTNTSCFGGANGTITASVSGGTPGYTYLWSTTPSAQTTVTANNLAAGTYTVTVTDLNGCTKTASTTITQPTIISISTSQVNVLCNGFATGSATATATGGTGSINYSWNTSPVQNTTTAINLAVGTYIVTATDANSCTKTASVTITQPPVIVLSNTQLNVLCNGSATGSIDLTVSGGTPAYTYNWGLGQPTTQDISGLSAGTYTVTVTDANGCTKTSAVTITQLPAIVITPSQVNVLCNGASTGTINLAVSGGSGTYTYNWGGGITSQNRTGLAAGSYSVTVTDANNCSKSTTITITQNTAVTLTTTQTNVSCNGGNNGTINLTATGGTSPYTYNWGAGIISQNRTGITAGSYNVTVTDANGCTASIGTTITQPNPITLSTTQINVLCNGASTGSLDLTVNGGTAPYTYNWGAGQPTTQDRTTLPAGTYTVTVTDANGCTATNSATITQLPVIVLTTTQINVNCFGSSTGSIDLTVSGGTSPYTYNWGAGQPTTQDISSLAAGTYTVTVSDVNGCTKTTSVIITQLPAISLTPTQVNVLCNGASTGSINLAVIGGTSPYTYNWGAGQPTTQNRTGLPAGTYSVTVSDANGCTKTTSVTITQNPAIVLSTTQVNVTCNGASSGSINLTVSGGTSPYSFNWGAGQPTTEDRTNLAAGLYSVTVTDANACTSNISATITQPNPITLSTTQINVLCNGANTGSLDLTVVGGVAPYSYNWGVGQPTSQDRTALSAGTYTVIVSDANGCTASISATITQLPAIVLTTTQVNVNCFGSSTGSIDLTVSGGTSPYTYNWGVGQPTTEDRNTLSAGTFSVTVTDVNGCTKTTSVTITQLPQLVLTNSTVNVLCNGANTGSIDLTVSGGTAPYTYNWGSGQPTTQDRSNLTAGTYSVIVTDANGCASNININITQPTPILLSTTQSNVSCNGAATGSIDLSVSGGTGAYTYNWGVGQPITQDRTGLTAGTYTVTVTDGNGCTNLISATITQPSALLLSLSQQNVLCNGASTGSIDLTIIGGVTPYTYNWGVGQPTTQDRTGLAAGTYSVTVTDANSCTSITSATITQPSVVVLNTTQVNVICNGASTGSINLTASGGVTPYTFNWGTGQPTTEDRSGLIAGTYTVTVTDANSCTKTISATITEPTPINLTFTQVNVLCNGSTSGSIDLTVTGGISPYTYNWGNGQATTQDRTGLGAGTYTVIVTDANLCTNQISITITQPLAILLSETHVNVSCNGGTNGSIDLTVSGGTGVYTYNWGAGQPNTQDRSGLTVGTYTVTVTDANNCSQSLSIAITEPTILIANTQQTNILCNGDASGSITLTVSGGVSPYSFNWGAGQPTTQNRSGLVAGTYNVTVTDANGCTKIANATITQPIPLVLSTTQLNVLCNGGNTGSIDLTVSGGVSPYSYNWGIGQPTNQDRSNLTEGTYSVTVTDINGCTKTISAVITEPTTIILSSTQVNVLCNGASSGSIDLTVSGGTSPYTYNWGAAQPTIQDRTGLVAGTYSVTVTDANSCSKQLSVTITQPNALLLTTTQVNILCKGAASGSIDLTVNGGTAPYSYNWGVSQPTSQDRTSLLAGTYSVTVTDANGCTKQISAILTEPTSIVLTSTKIDILCNGSSTGSIDLSVSGGVSPYTYNWGTGQPTTQDRNGLVAGTYNVTVTDANGCTKVTNSTINQPTVIALSATQVNILCNGLSSGSIDLTVTGGIAPYSYVWSNGATSQDISSLMSGTYTVTTTDANSCTKTLSIVITQPSILVLTETHVDVPCAGGTTGSVDLTVSGGVSPYTYAWSNGSNQQDISTLTSGNYTVTVTDANLCTKVLNVTISQNSGMAISEIILNVKCFGASTGAIDITVSGGVPLAGGTYTYLWNDGITTQDRTGLLAGNYSVVAKDANNCSVSKNYTITQPTQLVLTNTKVDITCNGASDGSIDLTVGGGSPAYIYLWSNGATSQDISNVTAGNYTVTVTDANGCTKTASVLLNQPLPGSIGNFTWIDANANGIFDNGELPIDGILVKLYIANGDGTPNGAAIASATTSGGGLYTFPNVCAGNYVIEFGTTGAYVRTTQPNNISKDPTDSDANPTTGFTGIIVMTAGENDPTNDAGFYLPASLGNFVWEDKNANGIQESGEQGIPSATVTLNGTTGSGATISLSTITNGLGEYIFSNLAPGNYTVTFVKPVGYSNSSPADQGGNDGTDSDANTITGIASSVNLLSGENNPTIDAGYFKPASLGDYVWEDKNANGQQDSGEPAISNVTVSLQDLAGNQATDINGNLVPSTSTDGAGNYKFNNLKPGISYIVAFSKPNGYSATASDLGNDILDSDANITTGKSSAIILASGEDNTTIDAGFYKPASLGDFVWDDKNANGIQDGGESGIVGVLVSLTGVDGAGNTINQTTNTGLNGQYLFANLAPGNYTVTFTKPAGYSPSSPDMGGNDNTDSDANINTGQAPQVTLLSGDNNLTIDAGFYKPASLGDYVWEDKNANGQQDGGEPFISGVSVSLLDLFGNPALDNNGNLISSTTTNGSGIYSFTNLKPGIPYIVSFSTPSGYIPTSENIGADATDSDASKLTGKAPSVILSSGEINTTIDAGYYKPASLGDFVWDDKNANGIQDFGEPGIQNATVSLTGTDAAGNPISTSTITDINGAYSFTNLAPGNYTVIFTKPAGYTNASLADQGGNDIKDSDANILTGIAPTVTLVSGDNNITIDAGFYKPASLGDYVWEDKNANGQQDAGEQGINGVIVSLKDQLGNPALDINGNIVASTTTNSSGLYSFVNLKPGNTYVVVFSAPSGFQPTGVNVGNDISDSDADITNGKAPAVTLASGENNTTIDAGFYKLGSIGNFVWEDKNANGIQDGNESGILGVTVTLNGTNGAGNSVSLTTLTGANGEYLFPNLLPGNYTVTFSKPAGYSPSPNDLGGNDETDSDANLITGQAPIIALVSGENNLTIDAGFYKPASLGDYVWEDKNANGQQDPGEPVISGVTVSIEDVLGNPALDNNGTIIPATLTNGSGLYSFTNLKPGLVYVVKFTAPVGFVSTSANVGNDLTDSDASISNGKAPAISLISGENNTTIDAGFYKPASLGDFVWEDKNANGIQDLGEPGINGATVQLNGTDAAGNIINLTTSTNSSGIYSFTNLAPGNYQVTFVKPGGYATASPADLGGNDSKDSDANITTGISPAITLVSGDNILTIDAGFYNPASLGDYVWDDKNANGMQDSGEPFISGVIVSLQDAAGNPAINNNGLVVVSTSTNGSGLYSFNNLKPGVPYVVVFTKPSGYTSTAADKGGDDSKDSDANTITGKASAITLISGENNPTIDAGYYIPASLGDFVWEDKNANGVQDLGEVGIPNVLVTLTGTDGAGNPVSSSTTTNGSGAYAFNNLAPGTYTVTFSKPSGFTASPVDASGNDATDSDANITTGVTPAVTLISGDSNTTIDAGFFKPASLGDYVWEDKNANGIQDSGEPVIVGVTVSLEDASGNSATDINGAAVPNTTTNSLGLYSFVNLKPGIVYVVKFTTPVGFVPTTPNLGSDFTDSDALIANGKSQLVTLNSGENNTTIDAGYYKPASLGDFVWDDKNANGIQDAGEPGIAGAVVTLAGTDGAGNSVSLNTTTSGSGLYSFTNLAPGTYTVSFEKPAGYTSASPVDLGGNDTKDSDANITTGVAPTITLVSGESNITIDAGFYKPASLGDFVWLDKNANGIQDLGELGIQNVTVSLTGTNSLGAPITASTITDATGYYSFTNLLPGSYSVVFTKPNGYITTSVDKGGDDTKDSDANTITGIAPTVTLVSGENNPTIDAGYYLPASLGDFVWEDKNANGVQDSGEAGIPNVLVTLIGTDGAGNAVSTTITTNGSGAYAFNNLAPGSYTVTFSKPSGFIASPVDALGNDATDSDANITTGVTPVVLLLSGDSNITIDAGFFKPASIGDYVWEDKNANGIQDSGEPVIAGVTVNLTGTDGSGNAVSKSTTTDGLGNYLFANLIPGNYVVTFIKPAGFVNTAPDLGGNDSKDSDVNITTGASPTIALASGDINLTIDAGYFKPASIGDYVWEDKNANGQQDIGEPVIPNVIVSLEDASGNSALDYAGNVVPNTTTNGLGIYSFTNLKPGITYVVKFTTPIGFVLTNDNIGSDLSDSDPNITTGKTAGTILQSSENNTTLDAGFYKPASLGDFVWEDKNANGIQDMGELGIPGVIVSLTGTTASGAPVSQSVATGPNGEYLFSNLSPGNYTVIFTKPATFTNASPTNQGGNDAKDSDASTVTGIAPTVTLVSGDNNTTVDAGYYNLARIGDFVWEDKNANGVQDIGEPAISGVTVSLTGTNAFGAVISLTTTTNIAGAYLFDNLIPGNYTVVFTKPTGFSTTAIDLGGNDLMDSDANITTGITPQVSLLSGESNLTIDAGYYKPASLGDFVWEDKNANGIQDIGETGIPNVIVELTGIDGAGNPVSTTTSTGPNGEYIFNNLVPGSYTVTFINPAGFIPTGANLGGNDEKDSDANSSGVTPTVILTSGESNKTVDAGYFKPASLGDYVWEDKNGDGQQGAEPAIQGAIVSLLDNAGNPAKDINGAVILSTITNALGYYQFTNLMPGIEYIVKFEAPAGSTYILTAKDKGADVSDSDANKADGKTTAIILASGENNTTIDAGFVKPASLGDFVWDDKNANGIQDTGELGIAGVTVNLSGTDGVGNAISLTTLTGPNGEYSFSNLLPGIYSVAFIKPAGYNSTTANFGGNDSIDSDANALTGVVPAVTLLSGENNPTIDAGYYKLGSIGDFVWDDKNANGIQDSGEIGIAGVTVSLTGTDGQGNIVSLSTITGPNGEYIFSNLLPGTYTVIFTKPNGYNSSPTGQGGNPATDSDANSITGIVPTVTLLSGQNITTIDAGYYKLASLGDYAWYDWNQNGIQDKLADGITNEIPMANIQVDLFKGDGTQVGTTFTNGVGFYQFTNLVPGDYYISSHGQTNTGYIITEPNVGDDAKDSDIERVTYRSTTTTLVSGENDPTWDLGSYRAPESIKDPCKCRNNATNSVNGQFDERIDIDATPGGVWKIVSQTGMYLISSPEPPLAPIPVPVGTIIPQVSGSIDMWSFPFRHIDAIGYSVVLTDGISTLTISNNCVYPDVNFAGVPGKVCLYDPTYTLTSTPSVPGSVKYTVVKNGVSTVVSTFDPAIFGLGPVEVIAELIPTDPNLCVDKISLGTVIVNDCAASLGNYVWNDLNSNGLQDLGEPGIKDVWVKLTKPDNSTEIVVTDANGLYSFTGLIPGAVYSLTFGPAGSLQITSSNAGSDDALDSDPINGVITNIVLAAGENNTTFDAGYKTVALPINLISFTGKKVNESAVLNWKVDKEKDFSHFEIQRSENAREFGFIGKVDAANASYYNFTDAKPEEGNNYYRLKMVDKDGTYKYSNIISVEFNKVKYFVSVENPARNGEFTVSTDIKDPVFNIITMLGSRSEAIIIAIDENKYLVRLPNYIAGTYFLTITSDNKIVTKKVIVP